MFVQSVADDPVIAAVRPEVEACVRALLADHLGVDTEQITPEVSLVDDLAADSLDLHHHAVLYDGGHGAVAEPAQRRVDAIERLVCPIRGGAGRETVLTRVSHG